MGKRTAPTPFSYILKDLEIRIHAESGVFIGRVFKTINVSMKKKLFSYPLLLTLLSAVSIVFVACDKKDPIPNYGDLIVGRWLLHVDPQNSPERKTVVEFSRNGTYKAEDYSGYNNKNTLGNYQGTYDGTFAISDSKITITGSSQIAGVYIIEGLVENGCRFVRADYPNEYPYLVGGNYTGSFPTYTNPESDDPDPVVPDPDVPDPIDSEHAPSGVEAVDLGLSVKWASFNVGAKKISDYGNYYNCGMITTWTSNYNENAITVPNISGNSTYDVARKAWGGKWRMPTKAEIEELCNKCTAKWDTQNGVAGVKLSRNGKSIFLPAAGYYDWSGATKPESKGTHGGIWAATRHSEYTGSAWSLCFDNGEGGEAYIVYNERLMGMSVRPVKE